VSRALLKEFFPFMNRKIRSRYQCELASASEVISVDRKVSVEKAAHAPVSAHRLHRACALFLARSRRSSGLIIAQ
jgi:hypothetical protein